MPGSIKAEPRRPLVIAFRTCARLLWSSSSFKMYTFVALLVCVMAASARPFTDQPCVSPKQWEADENYEIDALNMTLVFKASYDAINKRTRALVQYDPEEHEFIIHYNEHRLYSIVRKTGKCTVSRYDNPFLPSQVPANAKLVDSGFIGLKNTGLPYKAYYWEFEKKGSKGYSVITVTERDCVLVYSKAVLKGITTRVSLYNVQLGIKDPSIFTPPKSCEEGPVPDVLKVRGLH